MLVKKMRASAISTRLFKIALVASVATTTLSAMATTYTVTLANEAIPGGSTRLLLSNFNGKTFAAGDTVQFLRGTTYQIDKNLCLKGSGSAGKPITLTATGSGAMPKIIGGEKGCAGWPNPSALTLMNLSYINIDSIEFAAGGALNGILVWSVSAAKGISNIHVTNVNVHDFKRNGFQLYAFVDSNEIRIDSSTFTNNGSDKTYCVNGFDCNGVEYTGVTNSSGEFTLSNSSVTNSAVNGNGNVGIFLNHVTKVTVSGNTLVGNGGIYIAGVGIETSMISKTLISHNSVSGTHGVKVDGDGIDLDWGTQSTTVEYNYCFNNDGAGILDYYLNREPYLPSSGNTIRYNVVANSGRKNDYGGIDMTSSTGIVNPNTSMVYNNTIYNDNASGHGRGAIIVRRDPGADGSKTYWHAKILNNLIITNNTLGSRINLGLEVWGLNTTNTADFSSNAIYDVGGNPKVSSSVGEAGGISSFINLNKAGESLGLAYDGRSSPTIGANSAALFKVGSTSTLGGRGATVNLWSFATSPTVDYFNQALNLAADIGASSAPTMNGGPASQPAPSQVMIQSAGNPNYCANLWNNSSANGTALKIYTCSASSTNEIFQFNGDGTLRNSTGKKCLGVSAGSTANSATIILWDCLAASTDQQWQWIANAGDSSTGVLQNTKSGKCLDIYGSQYSNGTQLQIYSCTSSMNQAWRLIAK